jgi:hypothetical protein
VEGLYLDALACHTITTREIATREDTEMIEKWLVQIDENNPPATFDGTLAEAVSLEAEGYVVRPYPTPEQTRVAREWMRQGIGGD